MRDFIPAVYEAHGTHYRASDAENNLLNCIPWILNGDEIGACPRNSFGALANIPSSTNDRGRGLTTFGGEFDLYLDRTDYYWNGGNTDLTDTSSPGYAGNTGFNEEYTASFIEHRVSGVTNLVIASAGHTSTHASANHGNLWYAANASSAPASVSDADMPGNNGVSTTRGGASLDGYFFLCDINGQIHNSNLNDITAWTATDFLTAEREPDIGVYLGRHHDSLVYIGTKSIEFFYNNGNASGSPLARRSDIFHSVGCYYPNTIAEVGDTIYFVGTEKGSGWTSIYKLQNYQLTIISDATMENLLRNGAPNYPDLTELDSMQHALWLAHITASDSPGLIVTHDYFFTYYWHEKTNKWCKWEFGSTVSYRGGISASNWVNILPIIASNGSSSGGLVSQYQLTNGRVVYELGASNLIMEDWSSSNTPNVFIQFPRWDAGTDKKKRINWVRVIAAPIATSGSSQNPFNADLRWFDYKTAVASGPIPPDTNYSTGRTVNLNIRNAKVGRCGTTRERSFILDFPLGRGPVSIIKGLEIEYEIVGG